MKKLVSIIFLLTVALGFSQTELIANGNFSVGVTSWGGNAFTLTSGEAVFSSTLPAGNLWDTQLTQGGITLTNGISYTFTFQARAAANRNMTVAIQNSANAWTDQFRKIYSLTTTMQTFTETINCTFTANGSVQLGFLMAATGSTAAITYDNVSIKQVVVTTAPALTTTPATAITNTTATINGNISSNGGATITSYGFYWSTSAGFADGAGTQVVTGTSNTSGAITSNLTGLTTSTIYYYKAYATNSLGTTYGTQQSFTAITAPTLGTFTVPAKSTSDVPFTLTAPTSNSGGAFTYTSSNTAVATISGTTVTIVGTGTSVITANQAANGAYGSGSTTASFVVSAPSMQAAPLPPCRDVSDVVVSYNDAPYPGRPNTISTTGNNWGSHGIPTEISIGGNTTKLITNTDYAQIAFSPTVAAASMTFLHVDIYTTTASPSQVKVYVNPTTTTGYYDTPNGEWKSLDIPASSLGGFATVSIVKIDLYPLAYGTFYVDNIYFYRVPTPTFTQVPAVCSGATMTDLPTTSNNGITGTWSPTLNNTATTVYTFTPSPCPSSSTTTMTITVNPTPITTPIYHE